MSAVDATPGWYRQAACQGMNPALFYPDESSKMSQKRREKIVALCGSCDVRQECLDDALARREPEGMWGGLSPRQRDVLAGARARLSPASETFRRYGRQVVA